MIHIIVKELKDKLYDYRFIVVVLLLTVVSTASMINGYYQVQEAQQYVESEQLEFLEGLGSGGIGGSFTLRLFRIPQEMTMFHAGIEPALGTSASISMDLSENSSSFRIGSDLTSNEIITQKPMTALFGDFRFSFVIIYVFSLVSLLLSFNTISGEREDGTLQLALSNSISRSSFFFGKMLGGYLIVLLLLLIPSITGLLITQLLLGFSFSVRELLIFALFLLAAYCYLCFFFTAGMVASTAVSNSFLSFVIALSVWIVIVEVAPRTTAVAAASVSPVPSRFEVITEIAGVYFSELDMSERNETLKEYIGQTISMEQYRQILTSRRDRQDFFSRQEEIKRKADSLRQEHLNRKLRFFETMRAIAVISPASNLQFASNTIFDTGADIYKRFPRQADLHKPVFEEYFIAKQAESEDSGNNMGIIGQLQIEADEDGFARLKDLDSIQKTDLMSDFPRLETGSPALGMRFYRILPLLSLLIISIAVTLSIGFFMFLRYDVRN